MKLFKSKKGYDMKGHIAIGLAIIAILWYLNNLYKWIEVPVGNQFYLEIIGITVLFAMLPDADQPNSTISRYMTMALGSIAVLALLGHLVIQVGIYAVGLIVFLKIVGHRTIIHSVLAGLLASLPLYYFFGSIHFAIGLIAYTSHIVADNDFSWGFEKDHRFKLLKGRD